MDSKQVTTPVSPSRFFVSRSRSFLGSSCASESREELLRTWSSEDIGDNIELIKKDIEYNKKKMERLRAKLENSEKILKEWEDKYVETIQEEFVEKHGSSRDLLNPMRNK